jgi:hypothetical protein
MYLIIGVDFSTFIFIKNVGFAYIWLWRRIGKNKTLSLTVFNIISLIW